MILLGAVCLAAQNPPAPAIPLCPGLTTMLTADLESADLYQQTFAEKSPETIRGTTSIASRNPKIRTTRWKAAPEIAAWN